MSITRIAISLLTLQMAFSNLVIAQQAVQFSTEIKRARYCRTDYGVMLSLDVAAHFVNVGSTTLKITERNGFGTIRVAKTVRKAKVGVYELEITPDLAPLGVDGGVAVFTPRYLEAKQSWSTQDIIEIPVVFTETAPRDAIPLGNHYLVLTDSLTLATTNDLESTKSIPLVSPPIAFTVKRMSLESCVTPTR